jgi:hypothetical protein
MEAPVAKVVGPVDAAILDHHGYLDSTNEFFATTRKLVFGSAACAQQANCLPRSRRKRWRLAAMIPNVGGVIA